jgi:maltose alpha-D-glucosyltransferase/alpha-amylase
LAVLEAYVPNEGTAWSHACEELGRFFERVLTRHREEAPPSAGPVVLAELAKLETPVAVREVIGTYLDLAALLGRRTAEMHLALGADSDDPGLAPTPYTPHDRRAKYQSMRNLAGRTLRLLRGRVDHLPAAAADLARRVLGGYHRLLAMFEPYLTLRLSGLRIRVHGDFHLQQALFTGKDFVIIDFDGVPQDTLAERARKHTALRDVAGMIRSFDYAAKSVWLDGAVVRPDDRPTAAPWADAWRRWVSGSFLRAYLDATSGAGFLPAPEHFDLILDAHVAEKALRELGDELALGAETVVIPLAAIAELAKV